MTLYPVAGKKKQSGSYSHGMGLLHPLQQDARPKNETKTKARTAPLVFHFLEQLLGDHWGNPPCASDPMQSSYDSPNSNCYVYSFNKAFFIYFLLS